MSKAPKKTPSKKPTEAAAAPEAKTMAPAPVTEAAVVEAPPPAPEIEVAPPVEAAPEIEIKIPAAAPSEKPAAKKLASALTRKPSAVVKEAPKVEGPRSPIDEAIELALASASTAVDSAQEIQRLRSEVHGLIAGARRNNKILFYATMLILLVAGTGIFGSLVFYKRAYNEFEAVAKVNREALISFAGEINSLVAASTKIDEAVKSSNQALNGSAALTEEVKKNLQSLVVADTALAGKIPSMVSNEKALTALKQSIDELIASNKAIQMRLAEGALKAQPAAAASPAVRPIVRPPVRTAAKVAPRPVAKPKKPVSELDSMIHYP